MKPIDVLELRIHGIANSPPADALLAKDEEIEREEGDLQGSFWRIKPPKEERKTDASTEAAPAPAAAPTAEAYWWGNQARSGGSALVVIGRAIVHVGWLLVLPFGLCNLAYWARRDIKGEVETPELWHSGDGAGLIRVFALLQTLFYTVGLLAVSVHLIGIECFPVAKPGQPTEVCAALPAFLNFLVDLSPSARAALLAIVPIAVILFLYVVSRRARAGFHPQTSFDDESVRGRARSAQELSTPAVASVESSADDSSVPPRPALLGSLGFWQRTRTAETAERTHLAAVFAFVLMTLAVDAVLDATGVGVAEAFLPAGRVWEVALFPAVMALVGAGLVVCAICLAWGGALSGKRYGVRLKRGVATWVMVVAIVSFAAWLVWAFFFEPASPLIPPDAAAADAGSGLSGMVVAPTVIAAVGALIALASLSWGYGTPVRLLCGALILAALGFAIAATLADDPEATAWMSYTAAGLVIAAVVASYLPLLRKANRERARYAGWHGNGAAVALLVAWFSSLVITSLLVMGAYSWLSATTEDADTRGHLRTVRAAATDAPVAEAEPIALPVFYSRFATMLVVILAVIIVAAVLALIGGLRRFPAFSLPGIMFPKGLSADELAAQKERDVSLGGVERVYVPGQGAARAVEHADEPGSRAVSVDDYPTFEHQPSGRLREVANARRAAGLAHRGEPMLQLLAILTASALLVLGIPTLGTMLAQIPAWDQVNSLSGWALGLLALATVGWVVTNAVTSDERPLGLVWDIVCFFPRAGHPFTAPCYAERAVPEVAKRVRHHFEDAKKAGRDPYVVLSAHSMGATIAVATIFMLGQEDDAQVREAVAAHKDPAEVDLYVDRIALLTHGVQLRAYFSRFFPEVFGYRVLGTRATLGPGLVRVDPWERQVIDEARHPHVGFGPADDPATVVRLLGGGYLADPHARAPRWRNLWRRTDVLGFPVHGYASAVTREQDGTLRNENPIDRGATERCPKTYLWKVARHNDYLSTAQYVEARDELVAMLTTPPTSPPSERTPATRQERTVEAGEDRPRERRRQSS